MHIRPGRYRHYKGNEYLVLGTAQHSETEEVLVIYSSVRDLNIRWARPYPMFIEWVGSQGALVPRFTFIESL